MDFISIIYIITGLSLSFFFLINNNKNSKINNSVEIKYTKKVFLTKNELNFYNKLKKLEPEFKVIPQVNLNSIIKKTNSNNRLDLFRNIDFGIFEQNLENIILLIELNDSTHKQPERIKRDKMVKDICNKANIKLITFYTDYPNNEKYVLDRIKKEINNIIEKK